MINNVYIGIIARMGSERLPNKHIININEIPMIKYLINRMKVYFDDRMSI